jgi:hypothetical protein
MIAQDREAKKKAKMLLAAHTLDEIEIVSRSENNLKMSFLKVLHAQVFAILI